MSKKSYKPHHRPNVEPLSIRSTPFEGERLYSNLWEQRQDNNAIFDELRQLQSEYNKQSNLQPDPLFISRAQMEQLKARARHSSKPKMLTQRFLEHMAQRAIVLKGSDDV